MKSYKQEHELMRRKVWSDAWSRTSSASNCTDKNTPARYADAALAAFDERFPAMTDADEEQE